MEITLFLICFLSCTFVKEKWMVVIIFRLHWSPLNADLTNANLTDVCNFSFPTNLTEKLILIISAGFDFTFKQKSTIFWCKKNVFIWHLKNRDEMYILLNYWWKVGLLILITSFFQLLSENFTSFKLLKWFFLNTMFSEHLNLKDKQI